jgi:hypothetical protein
MRTPRDELGAASFGNRARLRFEAKTCRDGRKKQ